MTVLLPIAVAALMLGSWVFVGRPQPTAAQLARARAELRAARLPSG